MGTSSSGKGPRGHNPLIPSFLAGGNSDGAGDGVGNGAGGSAAGGDEEGASSEAANGGHAGDRSGGNRYQSPRTSFNRFAASGGGDRRSLGKAVSGYIRRSSGGTRGASQKMSISQATASRLVGVLNAASSAGPQEALRQIGLGTLAGRPSAEIFEALADVICPEGGTIDEAIARDAYVETMVSLQERGGIDFNALTPVQIEVILESFIAKSIDAKIFNEIGIQGIAVPQNSAAAQRVQDQLQDFIEGAVHDSIVGIRDRGGLVFGNQIEAIVHDIYQDAFEILLTVSERLEQE